MKILVLGGTVFLGRHTVEAALARGHEVTLFNRGRHEPDLFPGVEKLRGDRDGGLDVLRGRRWDAAIDTSGYVPRIVRASAELLADTVAHYTFISSISVYADSSQQQDERGSLARPDDPTTEEYNGPAYGGLKALCEQAAEDAMPGRVLNIRPGLIVGPHDPSGRFTYWPRRVAQGGEMLAPGRPDRAVQVIDVRDLAAWNVRMLEEGGTGTFNATGPDYVLTMGRLLDECAATAGGSARFTWIPEQFLLDAAVGPWMELPLWLPETPDRAGFMYTDCSNAIAAGLRFRPLVETIRDTLAWDRSDGTPPPAEGRPPAGMAPDREAELLRAWNAGEPAMRSPVAAT